MSSLHKNHFVSLSNGYNFVLVTLILSITSCHISWCWSGINQRTLTQNGFNQCCSNRGHSCIGNSGAVLRRSFTAAIPAVITPTQRPLKLSTRIACGIRPLLFPERCTPFFTCVFKFQFPKLLHKGGQWRWWQLNSRHPPPFLFRSRGFH